MQKADKELENKIENYVKEIIKKEELAHIDHINYLEKRLELLEDEVDRLILHSDIENMTDEELEEFLKSVGIEPEDLYTSKSGKKIYPKTYKSKKQQESELDLDDAEEGFEIPEFDDDLIEDLLSLEEDDLRRLLEIDDNEEVPLSRVPKIKYTSLKKKSKSKPKSKAKKIKIHSKKKQSKKASKKKGKK